MSITNIIINDGCTILQGVNGICLCQEKWMMREEHKHQKEKTDKTIKEKIINRDITTK